MQTSYAQRLKDLAHQYNTGRISLQQFRAQRRDLLTSAQAQLPAGQSSSIDAQQNIPRS